MLKLKREEELARRIPLVWADQTKSAEQPPPEEDENPSPPKRRRLEESSESLETPGCTSQSQDPVKKREGRSQPQECWVHAKPWMPEVETRSTQTAPSDNEEEPRIISMEAKEEKKRKENKEELQLKAFRILAEQNKRRDELRRAEMRA